MYQEANSRAGRVCRVAGRGVGSLVCRGMEVAGMAAADMGSDEDILYASFSLCKAALVLGMGMGMGIHFRLMTPNPVVVCILFWLSFSIFRISGIFCILCIIWNKDLGTWV